MNQQKSSEGRRNEVRELLLAGVLLALLSLTVI
jgi:hypothetical protein